MYDYVSKPINITDLFDAIERLLPAASKAQAYCDLGSASSTVRFS